MARALTIILAALFVQVAFCGEHKASEVTPDEAFARLKEGNLRFVEGKAKHPRADAARRAETAKDGQRPIAIVIGCADSREPIELIFDQGIGDVFVIRVAGNVCNTDEIGSTEYAVEHLGVSLCIVLGHTSCGAVTAAASNDELHGSVKTLVKSIKPAVAAAQKEHPELKDKALVPPATEANVRRSIADLKKHSREIAKLAAAGKLRIEGGVYDLESGQIKWLSAAPEREAAKTPADRE